MPAHAGRVECSAVPSKLLGRAVRYCAMLPPSYDAEKTRRYPILYYLHGLGENEQTFVDFGGWSLLENLQEAKRIGEYLVVIPEGGRSFYINSRDGKQRYEDFFLREFLPAVEAKYRVRAGRAARGIAGVSMGGYGALRLAFLRPEMFASVSAHSAALLAELPKNLPTSSRGLQGRLLALGETFGVPFDRAFWEKNHPLTLAQRAAGLGKLKIYFDCGTSDEYGFDAGARALAGALQARGIAHEFHLYPGGHGWAYLAEHVAATFQFHSAAFASTAK
jgi:S-formylglutathione hydrolase FrmB